MTHSQPPGDRGAASNLGRAMLEPGPRTAAEKIGRIGCFVVAIGLIVVILGTLAWFGAFVWNQLMTQVG